MRAALLAVLVALSGCTGVTGAVQDEVTKLPQTPVEYADEWSVTITGLNDEYVSSHTITKGSHFVTVRIQFVDEYDGEWPTQMRVENYFGVETAPMPDRGGSIKDDVLYQNHTTTYYFLDDQGDVISSFNVTVQESDS